MENIDDSLLQLEHIQQWLKWHSETRDKKTTIFKQRYETLKLEIEDLWLALLRELLIVNK